MYATPILVRQTTVTQRKEILDIDVDVQLLTIIDCHPCDFAAPALLGIYIELYLDQKIRS